MEDKNKNNTKHNDAKKGTKHNFTGKLSSYMALLSSLLNGVIVIIISMYVVMFLRNISLTINHQNVSTNRAIASSLFQALGSDIDKKSYSQITRTVNNAINNDLIAYFIVINNDSKKVEYSSIGYLKGKILSDYALKTILNNSNKSLSEYRDKTTYYIEGKKKESTMYVGFFSKALLTQDIEKFTNDMSFIAFLSILLGLLISHVFTRIITQPLNNLAVGSIKLANGNFEHRIKYFRYDEINTLVDSFNTMAENLQDLYTSLENKVAERTKELDKAYKELKDTQAMMVHSEKMKSLGELVAGITHEINNPINFIYGNLIHLTNYTNDMIMLLDKYGEFEPDLLEEHRKEIEQIKSDIDLAFLKDDIGSLIQSCREGTERTKNIILDLKNFSRMEERVVGSINIAKEIDTTLNILHSKYKNRIEIHKEFDENLPLVESFGGQLNQVFMNILDNAFYAIEGKGDVYITTLKDGKNVIIKFRDTGSGMAQETINKIFDPFYTTKPVGKGTGLGMSISYRVIKDHNGTIDIQSEIGKGTTFTITLPITFEKNSHPETKIEKESADNE